MKTIIATLLLFVLFASCDSKDSNIKYSYSYNSDGEIKREMSAKTASTDIDIEMVGTASFNAEGSLITGLTPGGSINYRNKDIELTVVPNKNSVKLTIEQNGVKISATSDTGKEVIAEAIRQIKKLQQKYK